MTTVNKNNIKDSTELKILEASKRVFLSKGLYGARMQEIADEAGINKALLHYYFRSKDKLFDAVFSDTAVRFFSKINELISTDKPLFEKIEYFISEYIDLLLENSFIPAFIISEVHQNPERIKKIIVKSGVNPRQIFAREINAAVKQKIIRPVEPVQLIVNILGLCVFPVAAKPIIKSMFVQGEDEYKRFMMQRKKDLAAFIINAIKVN